MKNGEQPKAYFTAAQLSSGNPKPVAPFAAQQAFAGRNRPDPSSAVRSDRYPIPAVAEYRMRIRD
jgi:hypothetical protein